jgi:antitoxin VapB
MSGKEVRLTRLGHGILVEPIEEDFSSLIEALEQFSPDFMENGRQQPPQQQREDLFE